MNTPQKPWGNESETAWMEPGVGVTVTFDYARAGCGSGTHRVYKRNDGEAKVSAEAKREQYLAMGFDCSPIVYRTGA